jgi:hypothetical protein
MYGAGNPGAKEEAFPNFLPTLLLLKVHVTLWLAQMGLLDVLTDYAVGIADTVHARPVSCVCGAKEQG